MKSLSARDGLWILSSLVALTGCALESPYEGPGYNSSDGTISSKDGCVVVAYTHGLLVEDDELRERFQESVGRVVDDLGNYDGFLAYSLRATADVREVWTVSVWEDEESMAAFVVGDAHLRAIDEGVPALTDGSFHHHEVDADEAPPSWSDAVHMIQEHERTTRSGP